MNGKLIKKEKDIEIWQHERGFDVVNNKAIETYTSNGITTSIYRGVSYLPHAHGAAITAFAELQKGNDIGRLTIFEHSK
ncbi:MAG TPA: hypothetical protein VIH86_10645 [Puia sp.]